jgi:hypothetical protein
VTPQRSVPHAGTFAEKAEMTPERWVTHAGTFAGKANAPAGMTIQIWYSLVCLRTFFAEPLDIAARAEYNI